jgi:hypothetical protein
MTTTQVLTREVANGIVYLTTEYRGTQYILRRASFGWELTTRRLNYGGRFHMGGFKRFDTLANVKASCKAFAAVELVEAL